MKLMHEKNHEFARILNCEIMKYEDALYENFLRVFTQYKYPGLH